MDRTNSSGRSGICETMFTGGARVADPTDISAEVVLTCGFRSPTRRSHGSWPPDRPRGEPRRGTPSAVWTRLPRRGRPARPGPPRRRSSFRPHPLVSPAMRIAVIGGTGDEGFGIALRLARAGHYVVIGSRSEERGAEAAERARHELGEDTPVDGTSNTTAAAGAELVFVTVPYAGQAEIYRSIKDRIPAGRIVVDTTTPLATAVGGRPWQVVRPWHGSAAEQAAALLPDGVRLVSGFHTVSAEPLQDLERSVEGDVRLCGDDAEATRQAGARAEQTPAP